MVHPACRQQVVHLLGPTVDLKVPARVVDQLHLQCLVVVEVGCVMVEAIPPVPQPVVVQQAVEAVVDQLHWQPVVPAERRVVLQV